jgi:hypothetical protein
MKRNRFDVDYALDTVDLRFSNYTPSTDALEFFNLIRVFMGEDFEVPNPKFHYFIVYMLYGNVTKEQFPYPNDLQDSILITSSQVGILASRGSAKALSLSSKVYTPEGYTTIGEVQVGDEVITRDGTTTKVLAKSEVFNKMWEFIEGKKVKV